MIPTIEYIQTRFDEYNARFFGGHLPSIPIHLSHAKGFLGKVCYTRKRQGLFGGYRNTDFVLRINVRIYLPEPTEALPLDNAHRLLVQSGTVRLQTTPSNPLKW